MNIAQMRPSGDSHQRNVGVNGTVDMITPRSRPPPGLAAHRARDEHPSMPTWDELRRRKIAQWALAYLAGAWLVLEVTSLVGGHFGWAGVVHRVLIILAAVGLPLAMVLAWYHGEKGRQRVSGAELLILAALLALAGIGIELVRGDTPDRATAVAPDLPVDERSVAVLPLDNLSPADEHAFFAGAMTEEITSALTEVPELTVKSRNSASQFTRSGLTVAEFASSIGVAYVIEGSVQRSGDRVRITVQLIDARHDEHVWAETYDRRLVDLFDLQVDVARQVADRLAASFTERERERILAGATDVPVAYDLYLQAGGLPGELNAQIDLLRQAVEHDPMFWPAWERLAFGYLARERRGDGAEWADSSRAAFRRAMDSANHPSTRLRLGAHEAVIFGGDPDEALARLRAAAEERPNDPVLASSLGRLYRTRGRLPESLYWERQAALLDPLRPERWQTLFPIYYWIRLYDEAERVLERALEVAPGQATVWHQFVWLRMVQDRIDEALAAADSAAAAGSPTALVERALAHWWAEDYENAARVHSQFEISGAERTPDWQFAPMAHARFAVGDSAGGRRIAGELRAMLESRALQDFEPEFRVFPRLQLAALEGDIPATVELFRLYVERGGRDPYWFRRSPLFVTAREHPEFLAELDALDRLVAGMRRQIERELSGRS